MNDSQTGGGGVYVYCNDLPHNRAICHSFFTFGINKILAHAFHAKIEKIDIFHVCKI